MSTYYNPPEKVKAGKRLSGRKHVSVSKSNRLVALMFNGMWYCAVDVTEKSEYDIFYAQYYSGAWLDFELYDLPDQKDR